MGKIPEFARFIHLTNQLKKDYPDPEFEGCDDILAYMCVREAEGVTVKMTALIQSLQFGTGPTVHRKVSLLAERGFIGIANSKTDGRAKDLSLTPADMDYLKERSKLMNQCL
jgi:DNA-binding MarR family transcriptional regulator